MKTAKLKNGVTLQYDRVTEHKGTHPKRPTETVAMYIFTRGNIGVVALMPTEDVETLDASD